jgi:hypothetical protein
MAERDGIVDLGLGIQDAKLEGFDIVMPGPLVGRQCILPGAKREGYRHVCVLNLIES